MTAAARNVLADCEEALGTLDEEQDARWWRVARAGAMALLWSVGHVLRKVDGERAASRPDGTVDHIFEFPVSYTVGGVGNRQFTADRAALARYLAKLQRVPRGTKHRLFCNYNGAHSEQPGWVSGARASLAGMRSSSFGTLVGGPHARAGMRYDRK